MDESHSQNLDDFDPKKYIEESFLLPNFIFLKSEDIILQENLQNGKTVHIKDIFPEENQHILIEFPEYSSLLQYKNQQFIIKRNDILDSSHKIHTK